MLRSPLPINRFERVIEGWLAPQLRLTLRATIAVVTNMVLCLVVLASIYVVQLITTHVGAKGQGQELGTWTLHFLGDAMPILDILVLVIFTVSGVTTAVRILFGHSE